MAYTSTTTVSPTVTSALLGKNTRAGGYIPFACAASRSSELSKIGSCNSQEIVQKQIIMIYLLIQSNIEPQLWGF